MADLLDDMAAHLVAEAIAIGGSPVAVWNGTVGTIFLGRMPDSVAEPDACISLNEDTGAPPLQTMGRNTAPIIERPRLVMLVRGAPSEYVQPRAVARAAWLALNRVANETVNGTFYQRVEPIGSIAPFECDAGDRWTFMASFDVMRSVS